MRVPDKGKDNTVHENNFSQSEEGNVKNIKNYRK